MIYLTVKRQSASLKIIYQRSIRSTQASRKCNVENKGLKFLLYENLIRKLESRNHNRTRKGFQVS